MRYFVVLGCGHGLSIENKVFAPKEGDQYTCRLCRGHPKQRVVTVSAKQITEDGKTYNG